MFLQFEHSLYKSPFALYLSNSLFEVELICSYYPWNVWKVYIYGVISRPDFPVFSPNTGKYRPEINPYMNTFQAVKLSFKTGTVHDFIAMSFHSSILVIDLTFHRFTRFTDNFFLLCGKLLEERVAIAFQ